MIARRATEPISVGLLGNAAEILPEMVKRGIRPGRGDRPDLGARSGQRLSADRLDRREMDRAARARSRSGRARAARASMAVHVEAMLAYPRRWASRPSIMATTSARSRRTRASTHAFDFPGFVPAYVRPLFCRGIGPFRWAALSGDPEDIYRTDAKVKELIPDDPHLHRWLDMARERIAFQGLPARICWVGLGPAPPARPRVQRDGGDRAN